MYNNYLYTILGFKGLPMNKNIVEKKYLSVSIDKSVISKLKTYSAKEGVMQYSSIANNLLSEASTSRKHMQNSKLFFQRNLLILLIIKKVDHLQKQKLLRDN